MTDVDFILGLIEARAEHYSACATTMFDVDEDVTEVQARFKAQEQALVELAAEITASVGSRSLMGTATPLSKPTTGYALITEMGGQMTATVYRTLNLAIRASEKFCAEAFVKGGMAPHASCDIQEIEIPPRRTTDFNEIDGRWALITEVQTRLQVSLCANYGDFQRSLGAAEDELRDHLAARDAAISSHILLIPAEPPKFAMRPSH